MVTQRKLPTWKQCKLDPSMEARRRAGLRKTRCVEHDFEVLIHLGSVGRSMRCKVCGKVERIHRKYPPKATAPVDYPQGQES